MRAIVVSESVELGRVDRVGAVQFPHRRRSAVSPVHHERHHEPHEQRQEYQECPNALVMMAPCARRWRDRAWFRPWLWWQAAASRKAIPRARPRRRLESACLTVRPVLEPHAIKAQVLIAPVTFGPAASVLRHTSGLMRIGRAMFSGTSVGSFRHVDHLGASECQHSSKGCAVRGPSKALQPRNARSPWHRLQQLRGRLDASHRDAKNGPHVTRTDFAEGTTVGEDDPVAGPKHLRGFVDRRGLQRPITAITARQQHLETGDNRTPHNVRGEAKPDHRSVVWHDAEDLGTRIDIRRVADR
mmetsp:Transcript_76945/g.213823  ORF Transcript_76945/g.213823 Transcript_76945/m.213823 type:complete len:300 (+) Transcript_76945:279-1178(+)